ncbi:hypothetical protein KGM_203358 [Danaus plexippus plexippus]|uniref:SAP30-binding protein n=1 Tax=Danaus plexippus plexippus TaxID=278856 RepID=A0A212F8H5_DANPL|nr:hypothetical protein KGM_203358 [Danaus plexippus plexippus]
MEDGDPTPEKSVTHHTQSAPTSPKNIDDTKQSASAPVSPKRSLVSYVDDTIVSDDEQLSPNAETQDDMRRLSMETDTDEAVPRSDPDDSEDSVLIPPEPTAKCPKELQDKITKFYTRMVNEGYDMNKIIQDKKNFRNPSIYEKLIQFCDINELDTNYPPEIYDPLKWGKESYYDELAKVQKLEMEKREKDRKEKSKIDFITGVAKKSDSDDDKKRKSKWDQAAPNVANKPSIKQPGLLQQPLTSNVTGTKGTVSDFEDSLSKYGIKKVLPVATSTPKKPVKSHSLHSSIQKKEKQKLSNKSDSTVTCDSFVKTDSTSSYRQAVSTELDYSSMSPNSAASSDSAGAVQGTLVSPHTHDLQDSRNEGLHLTPRETQNIIKCAHILGNVLTKAIERQSKEYEYSQEKIQELYVEKPMPETEIKKKNLTLDLKETVLPLEVKEEKRWESVPTQTDISLPNTKSAPKIFESILRQLSRSSIDEAEKTIIECQEENTEENETGQWKTSTGISTFREDNSGEWGQFWANYNNSLASVPSRYYDQCPTPYRTEDIDLADLEFSTEGSRKRSPENIKTINNIIRNEGLHLTPRETQNIIKCAHILGNVLTKAIERQSKEYEYSQEKIQELYVEKPMPETEIKKKNLTLDLKETVLPLEVKEEKRWESVPTQTDISLPNTKSAPKIFESILRQLSRSSIDEAEKTIIECQEENTEENESKETK